MKKKKRKKLCDLSVTFLLLTEEEVLEHDTGDEIIQTVLV